MNRPNRYALMSLLLGCGLLFLGLALLDAPRMAFAQEATAEPQTPGDIVVTGDDSYCLMCHTQPGQTTLLPDGAALDVSVDPQVIADSVHGTRNEQGRLGCVDCHGQKTYPHIEPLPPTARLYTIEQAATICATCHEDKARDLADDLHYTALANGNLRAATCVDCHGAHDVQPPDEPRERISQTCGSCHTITYTIYAESVHGQALLEGDPNVPTCIDCHGVHGIQHPTTALFRNRSPELCADCHADEELMAEYDITTNVFNSYLTEFHGTTVALFEQSDPNVPSNKAVCFDCHGVHNIAPVDAENSQVVRENLLATCQKCHPNATADFPASWVGHFPPSLTNHPLVFLVDVFYAIVIPLTLGAFILLVMTDVIRRIREFLRRGGQRKGA